MNTEEILEERGKRYGKFEDNAEIAQALKNVVRLHEKWELLYDDQKECIDMIFSKISRIIIGDPHYADNWQDIAGYAELVAKRLHGL